MDYQQIHDKKGAPRESTDKCDKTFYIITLSETSSENFIFISFKDMNPTTGILCGGMMLCNFMHIKYSALSIFIRIPAYY